MMNLKMCSSDSTFARYWNKGMGYYVSGRTDAMYFVHFPETLFSDVVKTFFISLHLFHQLSSFSLME